MPTAAAMHPARSVASPPTRIDERAPWTVREKTSQPWTSYPNQAPPPGGRILRVSVQSAGSTPVNSPGNAAIARMTATIATDSQKTGRRRSIRQASLRIADPRVQHRVEQVDDEVGEEEDQYQDADERHHGRAVVRPYRLGQREADTRHVEDVLDDHRAGHQAAQFHAEERDDRDQRVAQHVYADHASRGQALGPGGPRVVGAQVLYHGGPGQPYRRGERERAEQQGGQDQRVERALVRHREDAQLDAEQVLAEEAEHHQRYPDHDERQQQRRHVDDATAADPGEHPRADPDHDHEDHRDRGQLHRVRPRVAEDVGDRPQVQRLAEIAAQQVGEPVAVAVPEPGEAGVVEVEVLRQVGPLRGADRLLADQRLDRVTLDPEHHRVHDQRGTEERDDHLQQSPDDEAQHARLSRPTW